MKDYKFEGALSIRRLRSVIRSYIRTEHKVESTMEKASPVGNTIVSRNSINYIKNGLDFGAQRSPDA